MTALGENERSFFLAHFFLIVNHRMEYKQYRACGKQRHVVSEGETKRKERKKRHVCTPHPKYL